MDSSEATRGPTPTILHEIENDGEGNSYERSLGTGVGRRAMREMMDLRKHEASSPFPTTSHLRSHPTNDNDREKVNFVRMLLAVKMSKNDGECHEVVPGVHIGSIGAAWNRESLKEAGITDILCLCEGVGEKVSQFIDTKMEVCRSDRLINRHH